VRSSRLGRRLQSAAEAQLALTHRIDARCAYALDMADFAIPRSWDRTGLLSVGFGGFLPFIGLNIEGLPKRRGVYVILREARDRPTFIRANVITRRSAYDVDLLEAKWLDGQGIVYIGSAEPVDGLRGRLGGYSKQSSSHTGGRASWQLSDAAELVVAWAEAPEHSAVAVE
jgi:hypothetical protein